MTVLSDLIDGLVVELSRIGVRTDDILLEMDPRTTVELLPDWERVADLPDPCAAAPVTIPDRQAALTARITSRGGDTGGSTVAMLLAIAVELGYADAFVRRFHLPAFTCTSLCSDPLNSRNAGWPFVYEIVLPHDDGQTNGDIVKCQIDRTAMAHLGLTYSFPLFLATDVTHVRSGTAVMFAPETQKQSALADGVLGTIYYGHHED